MARLLIVDDEADVRGIEVLTAAGGEEALSILQKEKADLVLIVFLEHVPLKWIRPM